MEKKDINNLYEKRISEIENALKSLYKLNKNIFKTIEELNKNMEKIIKIEKLKKDIKNSEKVKW